VSKSMPTSPVRSRLKSLVRDRFGNKNTNLEERCELGTGTVGKWLDRAQKRVPDGQSLMRMAKYADVSPTWVLTGEPPELISSSRARADLAVDLRAEIASRLSEVAVVFLPSADNLLEGIISELCPRLERDGKRRAEDLQQFAAEWDRAMKEGAAHDEALRRLTRDPVDLLGFKTSQAGFAESPGDKRFHRQGRAAPAGKTKAGR
jgi:hypothetical protein